MSIPRGKFESQDCCLVKVYEHIIVWGEGEACCDILSEDDRFISFFYVKEYAEFLKTMWFCKENHIPVFFNDNDSIIDKYSEKYDNPIFDEYIYDIWLTMPTEESLMCINISI